MSRDSSEVINRVQGILTTLDQKRTDYERAKSDLMRLNIMLGKTMEAIQNSRRQLIVELAKLDPDGFAWIEYQEKVGVPAEERDSATTVLL